MAGRPGATQGTRLSVDDAQVARLVREGATVREVARLLDRQTATIQASLRRTGVKAQRRPPPLPEEAFDVDWAVQRYNDGDTLEDIAIDLLKSRQAVWKRLRRHPDYKPRTQAGPSRILDDAKVLELWQSGVKPRDIAQRFHCAPVTVQRSLRRSGVKMYGPGATARRAAPS